MIHTAKCVPFILSLNTEDLSHVNNAYARNNVTMFMLRENTQDRQYAWLSNWNVSVKCLPSLQQNFTHTRSSSSFIVTLSLIRRTTCARAQFGWCSSATNGRSEMRQMAVCCQNLPLGVLSSRSALPVPVGALFKKFGLFLNTPCTYKRDFGTHFLKHLAVEKQ